MIKYICYLFQILGYPFGPNLLNEMTPVGPVCVIPARRPLAATSRPAITKNIGHHKVGPIRSELSFDKLKRQLTFSKPLLTGIRLPLILYSILLMMNSLYVHTHTWIPDRIYKIQERMTGERFGTLLQYSNYWLTAFIIKPILILSHLSNWIYPVRSSRLTRIYAALRDLSKLFEEIYRSRKRFELEHGGLTNRRTPIRWIILLICSLIFVLALNIFKASVAVEFFYLILKRNPNGGYPLKVQMPDKPEETLYFTFVKSVDVLLVPLEEIITGMGMTLMPILVTTISIMVIYILENYQLEVDKWEDDQQARGLSGWNSKEERGNVGLSHLADPLIRLVILLSDLNDLLGMGILVSFTFNIISIIFSLYTVILGLSGCIYFYAAQTSLSVWLLMSTAALSGLMNYRKNSLVNRILLLGGHRRGQNVSIIKPSPPFDLLNVNCNDNLEIRSEWKTCVSVSRGPELTDHNGDIAHMKFTQILQSPIQFSACGFYSLDQLLISSLIGVCTTYIIVMIQFYQNDPMTDEMASQLNITQSIL